MSALPREVTDRQYAQVLHNAQHAQQVNAQRGLGLYARKFLAKAVQPDEHLALRQLRLEHIAVRAAPVRDIEHIALL